MVNILDKLPRKVFKAFNQKEYAQNFVKDGQIRIGSLKSYTKTECESRHDASEGEGRIKKPDELTTVHIGRKTNEVVYRTMAPGILNVSISFINPTYIYCVSGPNVDYDFITKKFGVNLVEIFDTHKFLFEFENKINKHSFGKLHLSSIVVFEVQYNKDEIGEYKGDDDIKISLSQKPRAYENECEWRIAIILGGDLRDQQLEPFFLNLNNSIEFCKLI